MKNITINHDQVGEQARLDPTDMQSPMRNRSAAVVVAERITSIGAWTWARRANSVS